MLPCPPSRFSRWAIGCPISYCPTLVARPSVTIFPRSASLWSCLSAIGKPLVLVICAHPNGEVLRPFAERAEALAVATVIFVTSLPPLENAALAQELRLPFALLSDVSGEVVTALLNDGRGAKSMPRVATFTSDPNQRIRRVDRGRHAARQVEKALGCLKRMLPPPDPVPVSRPAPLLYVPGVLDAAGCRDLIGIWHREGNVDTGTINVFNDRVETKDHGTKVRRDHYVRDRRVLADLSLLMDRRIVPEVSKAFCFRVSRVEEFKIGRYTGEEGGFFRPHKDNLSETTAHRRFAMSLLLNDPDAYEGGELRFMEYGPELYKPGAGDAVVFSCSLLHEVLPVTRGKRFVLLCFMFGDAEAQALEARRRRDAATAR